MNDELWSVYYKYEVFEYLDKLRESGETNMLGARPYLQEQFAMHKDDASLALGAWMETFGERHPA